MIRTVCLLALLASVSSGVQAGSKPEPVQLSPIDPPGAPSIKSTLPDGTVLTDTTIFQSADTAVAVGRVAIEGPALPKENIDYSDVFLVTRGSATVTGPDGKSSRIKAGDIVMLPRGLLLDARDLRGYKHLYASFDRQKEFSVAGPKLLQRLRPEKLHRDEFVEANGVLRHEYYTGQGGVVVTAERFRDQSSGAGKRQAAESRLMFVAGGSGSIVDSQGHELPLRPHTALLIPRGAEFQMSSRKLLTVTVLFDRTAPIEGTGK